MPARIPNSDSWLAGQVAQLKRDVAALKAQQTQYVVDSSGTTQAIIGNLAYNPSGNATGLSGFGVATWNGSHWQRDNSPDTAGNAVFLQLLSAQKSQPVTGTLTWPAASAFSNSLTITLSGYGNDVYGVFSPTGNVGNPGFFDAGIITTFAPGNGGLVIQAKTAGGGSPGTSGTMGYVGLVWG